MSSTPLNKPSGSAANTQASASVDDSGNYIDWKHILNSMTSKNPDGKFADTDTEVSFRPPVYKARIAGKKTEAQNLTGFFMELNAANNASCDPNKTGKSFLLDFIQDQDIAIQYEKFKSKQFAAESLDKIENIFHNLAGRSVTEYEEEALLNNEESLLEKIITFKIKGDYQGIIGIAENIYYHNSKGSSSDGEKIEGACGKDDPPEGAVGGESNEGCDFLLHLLMKIHSASAYYAEGHYEKAADLMERCQKQLDQEQLDDREEDNFVKLRYERSYACIGLHNAYMMLGNQNLKDEKPSDAEANLKKALKYSLKVKEIHATGLSYDPPAIEENGLCVLENELGVSNQAPIGTVGLNSCTALAMHSGNVVTLSHLTYGSYTYYKSAVTQQYKLQQELGGERGDIKARLFGGWGAFFDCDTDEESLADASRSNIKNLLLAISGLDLDLISSRLGAFDNPSSFVILPNSFHVLHNAPNGYDQLRLTEFYVNQRNADEMMKVTHAFDTTLFPDRLPFFLSGNNVRQAIDFKTNLQKKLADDPDNPTRKALMAYNILVSGNDGLYLPFADDIMQAWEMLEAQAIPQVKSFLHASLLEKFGSADADGNFRFKDESGLLGQGNTVIFTADDQVLNSLAEYVCSQTGIFIGNHSDDFNKYVCSWIDTGKMLEVDLGRKTFSLRTDFFSLDLFKDYRPATAEIAGVSEKAFRCIARHYHAS